MEKLRQEAPLNFEKSELARLQSEKYFEEQEKIFDTLKRFSELIVNLNYEERSLNSDIERLVWALQGYKGHENLAVKPTPEEILADMEKTKGFHISEMDRSRITNTVVPMINDFCKKYGLDFKVEVRVGINAQGIEKEIEKAYNARMWELTRDLRE